MLIKKKKRRIQTYNRKNISAKEYYNRTKCITSNFLKIGDLVIIKKDKWYKQSKSFEYHPNTITKIMETMMTAI